MLVLLLLCEILSVVETVRLDVTVAAKPTVASGSFGHPYWSRMSMQSWLPALRARANAVCP